MMSNLGYLSGKEASAVEDLLSQAMDLYVLEQVAAINLSDFTDSALPTNLETRFRRLKSLPVSRQPDPVSSSKKLFSHSKSMAYYPDNKNRVNASSTSAFAVDEKRNFSGRIKSDHSVKSRPLVSSDDETRVFAGRIKRVPSVDSGLQSVKIGSSSCRFSRDGKVFSPQTTTQTVLKLLPKEKSRTRSASSASIDLVSSTSSSYPDQEEGSNRKPKSKLSISWFDKVSPSRAMGCLFFPKHKIIKQQKHNQEQQQIV